MQQHVPENMRFVSLIHDENIQSGRRCSERSSEVCFQAAGCTQVRKRMDLMAGLRHSTGRKWISRIFGRRMSEEDEPAGLGI